MIDHANSAVIIILEQCALALSVSIMINEDKKKLQVVAAIDVRYRNYIVTRITTRNKDTKLPYRAQRNSPSQRSSKKEKKMVQVSSQVKTVRKRGR
jgi:hypothetical protein